MRNITLSLVEIARSLGADRFQAIAKIFVWAALPEILAGVRRRAGLARSCFDYFAASLFDCPPLLLLRLTRKTNFGRPISTEASAQRPPGGHGSTTSNPFSL